MKKIILVLASIILLSGCARQKIAKYSQCVPSNVCNVKVVGVSYDPTTALKDLWDPIDAATEEFKREVEVSRYADSWNNVLSSLAGVKAKSDSTTSTYEDSARRLIVLYANAPSGKEEKDGYRLPKYRAVEADIKTPSGETKHETFYFKGGKVRGCSDVVSRTIDLTFNKIYGLYDARNELDDAFDEAYEHVDEEYREDILSLHYPSYRRPENL